jgi:hypothetical protein
LSALFIHRNDRPLLTSSRELHKDVEPIKVTVSGWTRKLPVRQLLNAFDVLIDSELSKRIFLKQIARHAYLIIM